MLITSIAKNEVFLINQTKTIEDKTSLSQLTNASVYSNDFSKYESDRFIISCIFCCSKNWRESFWQTCIIFSGITSLYCFVIHIFAACLNICKMFSSKNNIMIQIKSIIIILEEASYTIWSIKKSFKNISDKTKRCIIVCTNTIVK